VLDWNSFLTVRPRRRNELVALGGARLDHRGNDLWWSHALERLGWAEVRTSSLAPRGLRACRGIDSGRPPLPSTGSNLCCVGDAVACTSLQVAARPPRTRDCPAPNAAAALRGGRVSLVGALGTSGLLGLSWRRAGSSLGCSQRPAGRANAC